VANPTTNYGFVLPTPTDLVTDLPADFDVALQGVDTRLKALQPGTTLGDLAYSSATANTNTRLGIGSTSQVLTVVGGVPAWATPSGGLSWTSFTPSWGAFTVGNGTVVGKYATLGSSCFVTISAVLGSTSSVSGGMYFTAPVAMAGTNDRLVGQIMFQKSGAGAKAGVLRSLKAFDRMYLSPLSVSGSYLNADDQTSSTVPFTWATGDSFLIQGYWETA